MKHKNRFFVYKILIIAFVVTVFVWPNLIAQNAEIDSRALAIAIGVDVNHDDDRGAVLASAQILVSVPQGQQTSKQEVFFGTGRTLSEALDFISVKIGRVLDFGQVALIVFGEERAGEDVVPDLKYLINNKVRAEATLFVAHDGEARELLKKANNLSEEATSSLNNLLKYNAQSTYMPSICMLEFLTDSAGVSRSSFIPILNVEPQSTVTDSDGDKKKELEDIASGGSDGDGGQNSEEGKNEIKDVDRVFLFKNGKIAGILDKLQTKGLVWTNKDTHFGLFTVENVEIEGNKIQFLPCDLRGKRVSSRVAFENGVPVVTYKFRLQFSSEDLHEVIESYDKKKPFIRKKVNDTVKSAIEKKITEDMQKCLTKLKQSNVDALRLEHKFYKFKHNKYKDFKQKTENFLETIQLKHEFEIKFY